MRLPFRKLAARIASTASDADKPNRSRNIGTTGRLMRSRGLTPSHSAAASIAAECSRATLAGAHPSRGPPASVAREHALECGARDQQPVADLDHRYLAAMGCGVGLVPADTQQPRGLAHAERLAVVFRIHSSHERFPFLECSRLLRRYPSFLILDRVSFLVSIMKNNALPNLQTSYTRMAKFSLKWPIAAGRYRIETRHPAGPVPVLNPTGLFGRGKPKMRETIASSIGVGSYIVPNSDKVARYYDAMKVSGLYHHLASVETESDALNFANQFGLLNKTGDSHVDDFFAAAGMVRSLIHAKEKREWVPFERFLAQYRDVIRLNPEFQITTVRVNGINTDELEFFFRPTSLQAAIYIQLFEDFTTNAAQRLCKRPGCGTWFKYGPGTGRRNTALYCSPRCQKAHAYSLTKESRQ